MTGAEIVAKLLEKARVEMGRRAESLDLERGYITNQGVHIEKISVQNSLVRLTLSNGDKLALSVFD